jgi:hypothetical protein
LIFEETYDSWEWQHRWCQRVYGGNRLASGHLVKSSFFPAFPLLILSRTLVSSLYSSLTTRSLLAVPHPHLPYSCYSFYSVSFFLSNFIPSSSCFLLGPLLLRPQPPPTTQIWSI